MISDVSAEIPNPADVARWPLATPFASFGIASFGDRCAVAAGLDAATLLPVVKAVDATTEFRDGTGAFAELIVRVFNAGRAGSLPCGIVARADAAGSGPMGSVGPGQQRSPISRLAGGFRASGLDS